MDRAKQDKQAENGQKYTGDGIQLYEQSLRMKEDLESVVQAQEQPESHHPTQQSGKSMRTDDDRQIQLRASCA